MTAVIASKRKRSLWSPAPDSAVPVHRATSDHFVDCNNPGHGPAKDQASLFQSSELHKMSAEMRRFRSLKCLYSVGGPILLHRHCDHVLVYAMAMAPPWPRARCTDSHRGETPTNSAAAAPRPDSASTAAAAGAARAAGNWFSTPGCSAGAVYSSCSWLV